jgi:hypothetical protein
VHKNEPVRAIPIHTVEETHESPVVAVRGVVTNGVITKSVPAIHPIVTPVGVVGHLPVVHEHHVHEVPVPVPVKTPVITSVPEEKPIKETTIIVADKKNGENHAEKVKKVANQVKEINDKNQK